MDITNPQSWNRYAYALNNPLSNVDPTGLDYCSDNEGGAIADGDGGDNDVDCANAGGTWIQEQDPTNVSNVSDNSPPDVETADSIAPDIIAPGGCSASSGGGSSISSAASTVSAAFSSPGQYLSGVGSAGSMFGQFASGLGPSNLTFGTGSVQSQMMASSPGVTNAVNSYLSTGQSSGLYTFGASAVIAAGINPVQQFVGSYTYNITPGNGGLNVSLSNYTSVWSGSYHLLRSHQRSSFRPFGTTHQTFQVFVPCG